jgi:phosphoribosylformylglycinamidine synthase
MVRNKAVTSPLSLIITGFSPVLDVRKTLTPQLRTDQGDTELLLLDLGAGANRMGGSILAQVFSEFGDTAPDVDDAQALKGFFDSMQAVHRAGRYYRLPRSLGWRLVNHLGRDEFCGSCRVSLQTLPISMPIAWRCCLTKNWAV